MKIVLDDQRKMPEDKYRCVRTYEDCVYYLKIFKKIEFISAYGVHRRQPGGAERQ